MDIQASALIIIFTGCVLVTIGEMGDKTQLLAMAFATKFNAWKVMLGVLIATIINHTLAVIAGSLISQIVWLQNWIALIAAISFIFFGLWTLYGDKLDGEDKQKSRFGPVATVAIAFFIAEMGDKTQLLVISLAADPKYGSHPIYILIGTTIGMLIADGIGIILGVIMHKRIPESLIKLLAAIAFMLFGLVGIYEALVKNFHVNVISTLLIVTIIAGISFVISWILVKNRR